MKIKSIIACTLLSLTIVFSATGQTPTRPRSNQPQWEYLVVSFGKVYFSDPMTDPEAKSSGLSKLLSFSQAGIVIAKEGLSTQKSMDTLGKFGWELVGAVGVIGGDQEMLFKRAYDEGRSKQEEELIRQEGEKLRKILEDERTKSSLAVPATELVDLDEAERIEARNANRRAQEERFKTSTASVISGSVKTKSVLSNSTSATDTDLSANIVIDGTTQLLTGGNKYRSSEAKRLGESTLKAIMSAAGIREDTSYGRDSMLSYLLGKVKVSVDVVIVFGGKERVVATARSGGSW
ncbi:MAG: hypothetical protein WBC19_14400 [Pyrinomonadaceae bacterium]